MANVITEVVNIDGVIAHPNADRLDVVQIKGWFAVVKRGSFKIGDVAIYIPIDSVLPSWLEERIFPVGSKVKLSSGRIKSIRLRGAVSQGLLISTSDVSDKVNASMLSVGADLTSVLGISKYEPEAPSYQNYVSRNGVERPDNPNMFKYTDIENFKNYKNLFSDGELVYVTEKLHGTSARYGRVKKVCNTFTEIVKRKILTLIGRYDHYEMVIGSRSVQWPMDNDSVYLEIYNKYKFGDVIDNGEVLYGEIIGSGIQRGYAYGCESGEHKFFAYDVKKDGRWLEYEEFIVWCRNRSIPTVPCLYVGPYTMSQMLKLRDGDSLIGQQKVREGIVIKSVCESGSYIGRKILKFISDEYLLGDQTDFH